VTETDVFFNVGLATVTLFAGYYLNRFLDGRTLPKIGRARRKSLTGAWSGTYRQAGAGARPALSLPLKVNIKAGRRAVTGDMTVTDAEVTFEFTIAGSFHHDEYLRLTYDAVGKTEQAKDFGVVFLRLNSLANGLAGSIAGYGSVSEAMIAGSVELKKNPA
jgi:hypothetical protein